MAGPALTTLCVIKGIRVSCRGPAGTLTVKDQPVRDVPVEALGGVKVTSREPRELGRVVCPGHARGAPVKVLRPRDHGSPTADERLGACA